MKTLRKAMGYGMAAVAFFIMGAAFIISWAVITIFLFGIESNVNATHLIPAISLVVLSVFKRPMFARLVMRFEAFAQNLPLHEYEKTRLSI